ncbi:carboxy terminal-processing peptidase [Saprospiraceae bacterium]|nr:carboxy terminal-processing peptidase [Saprospiraceae bacterium]MDA9263231.1 carboxy terminal-processing peptidase [Saprospiraceae bacterium]MDB9914261.1 carboxy terminal-processing peptidase [Saprospiraceae bacterium]
MKNSAILVALASVIAFIAFISPFNFQEREAMILTGVMKFMDQVHYNPKMINDELSVVIFDKYIEALDSRKRFLTQEEVDELAQFRDKIDDQIKIKTFEMFEMSNELIEKGIQRGQRIYASIDVSALDLTSNDKVNLDYENRERPKNEKALKKYWEQLITYDIISKVETKIDKQVQKLQAMMLVPPAVDTAVVNSEKEPYVEKKRNELIAEAIEDHTKNYKKWFKRLNKQRRSDRFEQYLNAVTHQSDPHTTYFNPKKRDDFNINMGGKLEGIGARLQAEDDFIKIVSIVPGGPIWETKKAEADDLIIAIQQEGEDEVLNLYGMRLDDVVSKIRGKKGTVITLTLRKKDGSEILLAIERDEVITEETLAKSLIIDKVGSIENIGYIKLPKFYSSFEKKGGNSCAKDVASEIEKLKTVNVNGIILDLRNNTGGSLNDVVEMSGLFIKEGPIVQVKPRTRDAYVHRDKNPDVLYDGPLMILVNKYSASASEIIAAAMQDYKRAVIVGSTSTYGKGTVQRFYDLDRAFKGAEDYKPLGSLKMTTQKFFRVNGGSTQLIGVTPDIVLPDNYQYMDVGEKEYDHAMKWTEIDPVEYSQDVALLDHIDEVAATSKKRVDKNDKFTKVLSNAERIRKYRDNSTYSLNIDQFIKEMDQREEDSEQYKDLYDTDIASLKISNLKVDMDNINFDESKQARNQDWLDGMKKDFYLEEALSIMKDMIRLEDSFASIEQKLESSQN